MPDWPSLFFLAYLLVLIPWLALRSTRYLRDATAGKVVLPSRQAIWINTLISQLLMLALAWLIAGSISYPLFQLPSFGSREISAGIAALAVYFALRAIAGAMRSADERKRLFVYAIAPRTPSEWWLWSLTVLAASVAEEAAYRGVAMAILWYWLGNGWIAAAICSIAFAVAHSTQGWKSTVIIFGMAVVMHVLVWYSQTLIVAMVVHALYDFVAGYLIGREARTLETGVAVQQS